ncbi:MAG: pentapeptide repeat-containing protein [Lachnospiraceae bacterium]|nr:pentapeptide repeat-containing protein [Lachnospiraceae bacterium]
MVGVKIVVLDGYISDSGRIQIENINKEVKQYLISEYERVFQIKLEPDSLREVIDKMKGVDWKSFSKNINRPIVIVSNIPQWNKSYLSRNPDSEQLWIPFADFRANSSNNISPDDIITELITYLEKNTYNKGNRLDNISPDDIITKLKRLLEQYTNNKENRLDDISPDDIITELEKWVEQHTNNKGNSTDNTSPEFLITELRIWLEQQTNNKENKSLINIDLSGSYLIGAIFDGVDMFQACLEEATLTNASFQSTNLDKANLNKALLREANLSHASLVSSTLIETKLTEADLTQTHLNDADLTNANLSGADICGADFLNAHLKGTEFVFAQINGKTRFQKWEDATNISRKLNSDECTDFTGVNLDIIALTPEDRGNLEKNIRKLRWNKWYVEKSKWIKPSLCAEEDTKKKTPRCQVKQKQKIKLCLNYIFSPILFICRLIMVFSTHLFWVLSDYGTSTKRVLGSFVLWNALFATIYSICMMFFPNVFVNTNSVFSHAFQMGIIPIIQTLIQSNFVAFNPSILGIGSSLWWTVLSFIHVIGCYFILAALLTRVAIMFQKHSP